MKTLRPFLEDVIRVDTTNDGCTLQLHFSRPVTADDRKYLMDAHNAAVAALAHGDPVACKCHTDEQWRYCQIKDRCITIDAQSSHPAPQPSGPGPLGQQKWSKEDEMVAAWFKSAEQPSGPVQVKPLEWVSSGYGVTATTILGKYWVADGQFWSPGCSVSHPYRTDADAIAGAEAHYERQIRSALKNLDAQGGDT